MPDFAAMRRHMVDNQLRPAGIRDARLLDAIGDVPRELFLPAGRRVFAYLDSPAPLGSGRFLPAPASFAALVQLAEILPGDHVLDIGCGPAWSTAVLARLAADVTGFEWDAGLAASGRSSLSGLGVENARVLLGDLQRPPRREGGYDAIVIEGALTEVPPVLLSLLAEGGRLVAVLRRRNIGVAHLFRRQDAETSGRAIFDLPMPALLAKEGDNFAF